MKPLFEQDLNVVNVGLQGFADNIAAAGGEVTHLSWAPPAGADAAFGWTLAGMIGDPQDRGRQPHRLCPLPGRAAAPGGFRAGARRDPRPRRRERRILHAGPPIAWADMCGPQQGAIAGAILYEGWADDARGRREARGQWRGRSLSPATQHRAVGPMAGIISPSMPVWVVENTAAGNRAYCNVNEGLGKVLRFGANSPEVLDRLRWLGGEFFDRHAGRRARPGRSPDLKPLMAQALHMGDEVHNRNAAASALLFKRLTLALLGAELDSAADAARA